MAGKAWSLCMFYNLTGLMAELTRGKSLNLGATSKRYVVFGPLRTHTVTHIRIM